MSIQPRNHSHANTPVVQVLRQTGTCLKNLSEKILDLECEIWSAKAVLGEPEFQLTALQSLDFLKQASEDLAALLERVAEAVPLSIVASDLDVIAPMKLEALRRVVGASEVNLSESVKHEEVELF
jgi:hypothetical protein